MTCDAKMSRQSSYPKMNLNCIAKLHIVPASTPYATAAGDGDDACNRTRAEANFTLLAPEASVPEHPGEAAHRRRGIRCNAGLDGAEVPEKADLPLKRNQQNQRKTIPKTM